MVLDETPKSELDDVLKRVEPDEAGNVGAAAFGWAPAERAGMALLPNRDAEVLLPAAAEGAENRDEMAGVGADGTTELTGAALPNATPPLGAAPNREAPVDAVPLTLNKPPPLPGVPKRELPELAAEGFPKPKLVVDCCEADPPNRPA